MFLDTSGLLCLLNRSEASHSEAVGLYTAATSRVIHNYVLAEFVALASARGVRRSIALKYLADLLQNPDVQMIWVDRDLHDAAMDLLQRRQDKDYSLCDAVSFVLMKRHNVVQVLTTDRHFEQEGFLRLLIA